MNTPLMTGESTSFNLTGSGLKSPLHILHVEDNPNDAALVQFELKTAKIQHVTTCVQTREDFMAAIAVGGTDLILVDWALPGFSGAQVLEIMHDRWPEVPIILVSGELGEETAIEAMKGGATDYVLKQHMARLGPAIHRAMQEIAAREECQRLEAQFIQAQKMEVVGQLSGGVAHDFNNILAVIMGYSDLIAADLPLTSPLQEYVKEIRHATQSATGLTRQLLVFSRKQVLQPIVLDLNEVIADFNQMLRRLVDETIEMRVVAGNPLGRIKADAGYIGQILMNLVVNARDAMPNGGKLTIATEGVILDEAYASANPGSVPGEYVVMSVSDTGLGMSEEVKAHLFEAFFTTKPLGKGTGLGLATCQSIAQQSGGHINFHSQMGKGTTFKVYFPKVDQPLTVQPKAAVAGPLAGGTETLLVVEDNPSVRQLACGILGGLGYQVLTASNGQDALQVALEHEGAPISLAITDVIMPIMGGKVMAEWLKTYNPGIKILFTSGYTDETITHHGVLDAGVEFLSKPYTPAMLASRVRGMLDTSTAP